MELLRLSIKLVVRRERCNAPASPSRVTVSVSSSPSRSEAAAPGCSYSSERARVKRVRGKNPFYDGLPTCRTTAPAGR